MTTSEYSPSGVRVSLNNVDLWQKFYPKNEMIATKSGRKIFPELEVKIEGLDPKELYAVSFYLERVDNVKYTFSKVTGGWVKAVNGNKILPITRKQPLAAGEGSYWMQLPISFSSIRITNDPDYEDELLNDAPIFVSSMHKYQPVITVRKQSDGKEEEFRLTMTEFMAVTGFRNPEIAKLKKELNNNSPKNPGKRQASTEPEPSTTDTVTPPAGSPVSPPAKKARSLSPVPIHHQKTPLASLFMAPNNSPPPAVAPSSPMPICHQKQKKTPSPLPVAPNSSQKQIKVEPASPPSTPSPVMASPSSVPICHQKQTETLPPSSPSALGPNSSQKQIKVEPVSPPSTPPPAVTPSYMAPNNLQNQMVLPPTMTLPYMGSNHLQNSMLNPPVMAMPYMAPPAQNFATNPYWNSYGPWNMPQTPFDLIPQPSQWNMMHGAAQFGHPGFPQYPSGAGPSSSHQGLNGGNFYF